MIKVYNNSMVRPSVFNFLKTIIFSGKNEDKKNKFFIFIRNLKHLVKLLIVLNGQSWTIV